MLNIANTKNLREALLLSTLSERAVKLSLEFPPYIHHLLDLFKALQTGCKYSLSTKDLVYIPGIISQQAPLSHDCGTHRAIAYFLEPVLLLSLYSKTPLELELVGLTSSALDQSVDSLANCLIPMIKKYVPDWFCDIKILQRGYSTPGKVLFKSQPIKYIPARDLLDKGLVKKIRGVCSGTKVAPNLLNRTVSKCRELFNDYIPDVWITTDLGKKSASGYALSLVAETQNCLISVDAEHEEGTPEELGELASLRLLDEIMHCGCIDTTNQQYMLILMALSEKKVSKIK